jgi:predicted ArsR family transcriptional regulator
MPELEEGVMSLLQRHGPMRAGQLAKKFELSQRGATFLLSKLEREGKLKRL